MYRCTSTPYTENGVQNMLFNLISYFQNVFNIINLLN